MRLLDTLGSSEGPGLAKLCHELAPVSIAAAFAAWEKSAPRALQECCPLRSSPYGPQTAPQQRRFPKTAAWKCLGHGAEIFRAARRIGWQRSTQRVTLKCLEIPDPSA